MESAQITVHGAHVGLSAWVTDAHLAVYCTGTTPPREMTLQGFGEVRP